MRSNVRPFRPRVAAAPDWRARLSAVVIYLGLGAFLWYQMASDLPFGVFFLAGVFYAAFVHRGRVQWSYFLRYHFLQALMLFLMLYFGFYLLLLLFELVAGLTALTPLIADAKAPMMLAGLSLMLAGKGLFALAALSQALMAAIGKTPRIPVITPNVIYWV